MTDDPKQQMFAALGRVASGLYILTVQRGDQETGVLTSWVQQCSFDPPQVTIALKQGREINGWLTDGATFVLNVLDSSQTDAGGENGKISYMLMVNLLGNQRPELDRICDEQKEPVEQHNAIGITRSPVLNVLYVEDNHERDEVEYGGPEAEVADPYAFVIFDLQCRLQCRRNHERNNSNLPQNKRPACPIITTLHHTNFA